MTGLFVDGLFGDKLSQFSHSVSPDETPQTAVVLAPDVSYGVQAGLSKHALRSCASACSRNLRAIRERVKRASQPFNAHHALGRLSLKPSSGESYFAALKLPVVGAAPWRAVPLPVVGWNESILATIGYAHARRVFDYAEFPQVLNGARRKLQRDDSLSHRRQVYHVTVTVAA